MIHLGADGYLLLFAIVLAMAAGGVWLARWRRRARDAFAGPQGARWQAAAFWPRFILLLAAALLIAFAAARPQWGSREVTREHKVVDLVIALDVSQSMEATDADPSRLTLAKQELASLMSALPGYRVGLVLFAGSTVLRSPLTTDLQALTQLIERADRETRLVRAGSNLAGALDQAGLILQASDSTGKAVLLVSDGEDHSGGFRQKASELREQGVAVFTAGVGSPGGSTLNEIDPLSRQLRPKLDSQGSVVVTRLVEPNLRTIAEAGGGRYLRLRSGNPSLITLRQDISRLQLTTIGLQAQQQPIERFQLFAGAAFVLLVAAWLLPARLRLPFAARLASLRPRPSLALVLLALVVGGCGGDTLRDQNAAANRSFEAGDFEAALTAYAALLAERPDLPELAYNAGNTLHRLESYERAIEETQRALPPASTKLGAATYYALGNHLYALNRHEQAFDAYRNALLLDPSDADAKHNLELTLLALAAQQQQQPPPGQQPGEGPPGEQQQQPGQPGEGAPQQPQGQPSAQPPGGSQPAQQPARSLEQALRGLSEDLTYEEAIQILDALREQQQRQRLDNPPAGGGSSGPDY